jgi:alkanesulfonate monooxygenase SsuD/methylene tetrahydromethanopterin reductase-like flavin-dependent oxidoreductase (luciferase family)
MAKLYFFNGSQHGHINPTLGLTLALVEWASATRSTTSSRRSASQRIARSWPRLDESLDALNLIFTGEPVNYHGRYVTINDIEILPTAVQRPGVPIWVGGGWPGKPSMRRAARWDGAIPIMLPDPSSSPSPDLMSL